MHRNIKNLLQHLLESRGNVNKDLSLVFENLDTLGYMFSDSRSEPGIKSEVSLSSYNNLGEIITVALQPFTPWKRKTFSNGTIACNPLHYVHHGLREKWFYINGICAAPPVAILNGRELARVFHRRIHLIHTPTYGAIWDMYDSIIARTFRKDGKLSRPAFDVIKEALCSHDRVVLLSHSQGTIISSYIARKLLNDPTTRDLAAKLEMYCIGGVADSLAIDTELSEKYGHSVPYVEHFANGLDFFCRIGILAHLQQTAGNVFSLSHKKGHLLNDHYLGGIQRGDYCDKTSRLYQYVNGKQPKADHYLNH